MVKVEIILLNNKIQVSVIHAAVGYHMNFKIENRMQNIE